MGKDFSHINDNVSEVMLAEVTGGLSPVKNTSAVAGVTAMDSAGAETVDANGYETYSGPATQFEYNYDGTEVPHGSSPEAPPSGYGTWTQTQVDFNNGESDGSLSNIVAIGHTSQSGSAYALVENGSGFSTESISANQYNELLNQGENTNNVAEAQTSIGLTFNNEPV